MKIRVNKLHNGSPIRYLTSLREMDRPWIIAITLIILNLKWLRDNLFLLIRKLTVMNQIE
jgi:hypothetical protein